MEPRLPISSKWTPLPEELLAQIEDVFTRFFEEYDLDDREFRVEGNIYPSEIVLRVGLGKDGRIRQHNFEASLEFDPNKENALSEIHFAIDFLGQAWQDFLEEPVELEELPTDWQESLFENKKIYLRYSSINSQLEQEAELLLQDFEKKLVYEAPDKLDLDGLDDLDETDLDFTEVRLEEDSSSSSPDLH